MTLLEWRDEYRTGIDGVDYEHEELIGRINAVYALMENSADATDAADVVNGLGEIYGNIAAHFALEEQMMLRHDYPDYAEHRADHERLLDEIRDITEAYEKAAAPDRSGFEKRLQGWFGVHFKTHDARLHRMSGMDQHEPVNQLTLQTLIRNAKNKLLHRKS